MFKRHKISERIYSHRSQKEDITKLEPSEIKNFSKKIEIFNENLHDEQKKEIFPIKDPFKSQIFRLDSTDLIEKNESNSKTHKYNTVYKCCCGGHRTSLSNQTIEKEHNELSFYDKLKHSYTCTCGWCHLTSQEEKQQEDVELHEYCIKYCCCGGKCKPNEGKN